jgi:CoA:oxalate CoA-transferase
MTDSPDPILSGLRVLDLTRVMSGPYCTAMLADLGAEVIKIEQPGAGDIARDVGPHVSGKSSYFSLLNRGKRSIVLNLKNSRATELVVDLARQSDVLVENFRPGTMERLGLGYEALSAVNPKLVYASISGFGRTGPLAQLPAYDLVVQAMSGIMNLTGEREGRSFAVGESIADICSGVFASWGILAALLERNRSGQGRHLDISMLDCMFSMLMTALSRKLATGEEPTRVGNRHPETYPVDSFSSPDGDFVLVCFGDKSFHDLANAIGCAELSSDPRFATNADRNANQDELRRIIADWARNRSKESAVRILTEANVPCAPVWSLGDLLNSGHIEARGLLKRHAGRETTTLPFVSQPVRFSNESCAAAGPAPGLGEHTEEVLSGLLGLGSDEIKLLRETGVI